VTLGLLEGKEMDVAIIGAGPAGLSAALYAGRARLSTVVLEQGMVGGLAATTHWIGNYPGFPEAISGQDLMQRMEEQARRFKVEFVFTPVSGVSKDSERRFKVDTGEGELLAKTAIIATGSVRRRLGVPGEDKLQGLGVSYCATCDGPFFRDKHVLIVGGGDTAIVEAMFLTRFAKQVSVIHRRGELRATKVLQEAALRHPKIQFFWHSQVTEIVGENNVQGAVLKDARTGETKLVEADGIFIAVGIRPSSEFVKDMVETDERGYILTDDRMRTSTPGLFAAGDVRAKSLRQVVTAVSDGAIAATEADKYMSELQ
jgi:thioredoxin reductase (NADPH)